jgi:hypothetical protein
MVDDWTKWPILVCVDKIVDGFGSNNLIKIFMNVSLKGGELIGEDFSKKLICFEIDGVNVF